MHYFQCHSLKRHFLQFRNHIQIIFTQLPVPMHRSTVLSLARQAVSPFHVTKAPSVICFNTLCNVTLSAEVKSTALALNFLILKIHLPLQTDFCRHLPEVLCLLTRSWRNDQVNHQLWGYFLGGVSSVIWDANIYPCSFTVFHAFPRIQAPHFTRKLLQSH